MNNRLKKLKLNPVRYYSGLIRNDPQGIDLTMGEGHFNSPFNAKLKAYEALLKNNTKYGQIEGDATLRKKLIEKYYPQYKWDKEIVITNGSTQGMFSVLLSLISSYEDEIIIIGPYYPAYLQLVNLLGGKPVIIDSSKTEFKLTVDELDKVVTENTKAIIINEPNNPTGITYTKKEKEVLLNYFQMKSFYIIVDELYKIFTDNSFVSFAQLIDKQLKTKFIFINGLSKSHLMTGYRIGYVVCEERFNQALKNVNYLQISCISTIMQQAAIGALEDDYFAKFVSRYYLNNLNTLTDSLDFLNINYVKTTSGYYVFMDVSNFNVTGEEFCQLFSEKYHVALVPGKLFGDSYNPYIRISCCKDIKDVIKFIDLLTDYIDSTQKT